MFCGFCVELGLVDFECFYGVLRLGSGGVELMLCEGLVLRPGVGVVVGVVVGVDFCGLQGFDVVGLSRFQMGQVGFGEGVELLRV